MRWVFGEFELNEDRLELSRSGVPVGIQRTPLKILLHLLRSADRVVSGEELMQSIWPGVAVTPASLRRGMMSVRRALSGGKQARLLTVRGLGYRLDGPVQPLADHVPPSHGAETSERAHSATDSSAQSNPLERALDQTLGNGTRLVAIAEDGAGEASNSLRRFSHDAEQRGVATIWGQASGATGAGATFWPWRSLMELLLAPQAAAELAQAALNRASDTRLALFAEFASYFRNASARTPLIVLLEGLHQAQRPALLLLKFLVEQLRDAPCLFVASYRLASERGRQFTEQLRTLGLEVELLPSLRDPRAPPAA